MDFPEVWKWAEMTADEQKDAYRNLLSEFRKTNKLSEAFIKLAHRLSDY